MNSNRFLSSALFIASLAVSAGAQAQPTAASGPMAAASMEQHCAKLMAKHSHPAEKGAPVAISKSGPCGRMAATAPSKDKTRHFHPRDAKNQ